MHDQDKTSDEEKTPNDLAYAYAAVAGAVAELIASHPYPTVGASTLAYAVQQPLFCRRRRLRAIRLATLGRSSDSLMHALQWLCVSCTDRRSTQLPRVTRACIVLVSLWQGAR